MARNEQRKHPIALDWSRLLGFDQAARKRGDGPARLEDARLTKVGGKQCMIRNPAKVGLKTVLGSEQR